MIDLEAEERHSKMAKRIIEGPDADDTVTVSIQQLRNFASELGKELKKVEDDRDDLLQSCMQSAEETYQRNLREVGEQYAAVVRQLEAERQTLAMENLILRGMATRA